ncbi:MAG: hypothetical protein L3J83_10725, partial [Proteobacteria bacterium]|nr:hypothetical protein [Pseudomonadota bacterium]
TKTLSFPSLTSLPDEHVQLSTLQQAMLFEIAFARAEQILNGCVKANWDYCLNVAIRRQRHHFDAQIPK